MPGQGEVPGEATTVQSAWVKGKGSFWFNCQCAILLQTQLKFYLLYEILEHPFSLL